VDRPPTRAVVPLGVAARVWWFIALRSFGGPAGQIAVMHRELVERRRWIGERRFLHALSFCTVLPGPEAQQLAVYLGWLLNGTVGGLVAGTLFVLPGYVALLALSITYVAWGDTVVVEGLLGGIAPAVIAVVAQAMWRIGRRTVRHGVGVALAAGAFVALAVLSIPFPVVIAVAAVVGLVAARRWPGWAVPPAAPVGDDGRTPLVADDDLHGARGSWRRAGRIVGIGLALWATPVAAAAVALGGSHVLVDQGLFFAGTALVTFGGAYAVLSFVSRQAVDVHGWLLPGEMVHGLALAESTPGPLVMVLEFVGFLGAHRVPGPLDPWVAGVLGATLVVWVTFVPCFVLVFLGAPHIESLRHNRPVAAAFAGISTAVVGVIGNLAVFFAVHTLFEDTRRLEWWAVSIEAPVWAGVDAVAVVLTGVAAALLWWRRWGVLAVLGLCGALGAVGSVALG
jgi:chromate transporter